MRTTALTFAVATSALLLAACSSASPSTISSASTSTTSPTTVATVTDAPTADTPSTSDQVGVTTALDACQLVTAAEASALSGTTYETGKKVNNGNGGQSCVYSIPGHSLTVLLGEGTDAATAQAEWSQTQAEALKGFKAQTPPGVDIKWTTGTLPGLGDRAATVQGAANIMGHSVGAYAIYVLTGAKFFGIVDLTTEGTTASPAAMEAQAHTTLGRVG